MMIELEPEAVHLWVTVKYALRSGYSEAVLGIVSH
jgi:hypothetical protein